MFCKCRFLGGVSAGVARLSGGFGDVSVGFSLQKNSAKNNNDRCSQEALSELRCRYLGSVNYYATNSSTINSPRTIFV